MKLLSILSKFAELMKSGNDLAAKNNISADELDEAIEQVVDGVYQKIRYYPDYKNILKNSVLGSLVYINKLVESIPGPILISKTSFSTDPLVSAYFSTVSIMEEVFSNSTELKGFFSELENASLDEAYAMVCITKTEKTVSGMELHDDIVQRDVRQNRLSFSDHKILSPAASEREVRNGIKQCIFNGLVTHAAQQILEVEEKKKGLESRRCMLNSKLRTKQWQSGGLSELLASASENVDTESLENQILDNEKKLGKLPACWDAPRYYLEMIKKTLSKPEQFVSMKAQTYDITKAGIVCRGDCSESTNTIRINEVLIANVLERVVVIVRYPRKELLP